MDTDRTNPSALQGLVNGVEERLSVEEETPWIVYGPRWAQDRGAEEPPEGMDEPVWAPSAGWMEKREAPIGETGGPLALYAPDSNEELE